MNVMRLTGAEILLACLEQEGVQEIFGYPGGVVLPFYDKLVHSPIKHYLVRHEQNAAFAAEGYARSTGKVGVCISTSGPGATNLMTGLADAYMDSIPIVAITGQVSTHMIGSNAFQETDTVGISRPITKHNYLVKDPAEIPMVMKEAFYVASSGRPGPVVVDIPKDVFMKEAEYHPAETVNLPGYQLPLEPDPKQIEKAATLIREAERPVLYAGGGIVHSRAGEALRELAELAGIPVALTVMGLGALSSDHPLCMGMLGMHGRYATNTAVNHSDVLIGIGVRFDDRVTGNPKTFARNSTIIHVDVDPSEFDKNIKVDLHVVGDAKRALELLTQSLRRTRGEKGEKHRAAREAWRKQIAEWQKKNPLRYDPSAVEIKPQYLMEELDKMLDGEAIVSVDVGQHQMWAAQYLRFHSPRLWLNSGGLGSMGFGLPAAIGAQVANPKRLTVALVGDGGFQMSLPELGTLATYEIPVKIIIMNNQYLGMVRQWQELFYDRNYSEVEFPVFPDCERLAGAYSIPARVVEHPDELHSALTEALRAPGPFVLDVRVVREENVYPMIPAGKGIDEMILYGQQAPNGKSVAPARPVSSKATKQKVMEGEKQHDTHDFNLA